MTTEQIHDELKQSMQAWIDHHCDRADKAEAENKRLRDRVEYLESKKCGHTLAKEFSEQALQGGAV